MINSFSPVEHAFSLMSGFSQPWLIAGGWALDLYLGRLTREHKDVDVMLFRNDQMHLQRHFAGWHLYIAESGVLYPWRRGDFLHPPVHGLWAYRPEQLPPHTPDMQPELDFHLDDLSPSGAEWLFRRDPNITRSLDKVILLTERGIPYLAPEIALLYIAKGLRPEDNADFEQVSGALEAEPRAWLVQALATSVPGHAWLDRL